MMIVQLSLLAMIGLSICWPLYRAFPQGSLGQVQSHALWKVGLFILAGLLPLGLYMCLRPLNDLKQWYGIQAEYRELKQQVTQAQDPQILIDRITKQLAIAPNDADGWFLLGRIYYTQAQYQMATEAFEQAAKLAPSFNRLFHLLQSYFWQEHLQLHEQAMVLALHLLQVDPTHKTIRNMLAIDAFKRHYYHEAIALWQSIKTDPFLTLEERASIKQALSNAKEQLGPRVPYPPFKLSIIIALDPSLAGLKKPQRLFVYIKNPYQPGQPLLAISSQPTHWPWTVELSEAITGMLDKQALAYAPALMVYARLSNTAMKEAGDIEGYKVFLSRSKISDQITIVLDHTVLANG